MVLHGFDCKHTRISAVPIVSRASPIETVVGLDWLSRALVLIPSPHVRLLIEMPVVQDGMVLDISFDLDEQERRELLLFQELCP